MLARQDGPVPQPTIVGVYSGGVKTIIAPDGRPMTTAIRKRAVAIGFLELRGFHDDASAEVAHHTENKAVHLFSDENYRLVEMRLGLSTATLDPRLMTGSPHALSHPRCPEPCRRRHPTARELDAARRELS
jgi:hypothetical protein